MAKRVFSRRDFLKLASRLPLAALLKMPDALAWEPGLDAVKAWLADPGFFTTDFGGGRVIATNQFDPNEYVGFPADRPYDLSIYMNNSCGEACLATLWKLFFFLKYGFVPEVTIARIYNVFGHTKFQAGKKFFPPIIEWDGSMYYASMPLIIDALMLPLSPVVTELTPHFNAGFARLVYRLEWTTAFGKAAELRNQGGMVIAALRKHGGGHFVLATNVDKESGAIIIDSYDNSVVATNFRDFCPVMQDPWFPQTPERRSMISMFGILPTWDNPQRSWFPSQGNSFR